MRGRQPLIANGLPRLVANRDLFQRRICLLGVCLVVNQLPWAPVRSCKRSAFRVLRESASQIRRITNVKAIIAR